VAACRQTRQFAGDAIVFLAAQNHHWGRHSMRRAVSSGAANRLPWECALVEGQIMTAYVVDVPTRVCDLAHEVLTKNLQAIVDDILDQDGVSTIVFTSDFSKAAIVQQLGDCLPGVVYNDEARTFQAWHQTLKGAKSKYMMANEKRGAWSRLRKVSFDLQQVSFIRLTDKTLVKCGSFQTDFRNSNGQPRRPKVLINLERLKEETVYFVEF